MKGRALRTQILLAPLAVIGAALAALPSACSTSDENVAAGGECFLASDCAPGLICVPQKSGARVCSDDLSTVVGDPPAEGADAAAGETGTDAETPDAATPDVDVPDTNTPDTGTPDTGTDSGSSDAATD